MRAENSFVIKIKNFWILLKNEFHFFTIGKRIFIMNIPLYGNLGDHAIVKAEYFFFRKYFPKNRVFEVARAEFEPGIMKRVIRKKDLIVVTGGGYLGNLWQQEEDNVHFFLSMFPKQTKIIFPQTWYFMDNTEREQEIEKSKNFYRSVRNLRIILRDKLSFELAKEITGKVECCSYYPDIVTILNESEKKLPRKGVTLCLRTDKEKTLSDENIDRIKAILEHKRLSVKYVSTLVNQQIYLAEREELLQQKFDEFRSSRLVITDRLHGMIFSAITGTPCIAVNNVSKKVEGVYEWIKKLSYVRCVNSEDISQKMIEEMLAIGGQEYNTQVVEQYFDDMAEEITEIWK